MVINKIDNNNKNNKKNVEIIGFLCSSFQLINNQYFGSKRMAYWVYLKFHLYNFLETQQLMLGPKN